MNRTSPDGAGPHRRGVSIHRRGGWVLLVLAVAAGWGCGHAGASGRGVADRNVIGEAEMAEWRATGITNAWDLVDRARPRWLGSSRIQSVSTPTAVMVYLGNTPLGRVDQLRGIPVDMVRELRWLDSAEAGMLPGAGSAHVEGAIIIVPRDG